MINNFVRTIKQDIICAYERDPAARSDVDIFLNYPGLHAIWIHRLAHWMWKHHQKLLGRLLSQFNRSLTGIEIHPAAHIGTRFFIDHGMGVVIGETAIIGENVTMYHGVTLGGVKIEKGKRHPSIEDNVVIGAGAKILGNITIGKGSRIGANAVVVQSVPANSVVIGVPGQVVVRSQPRLQPDLNHGQLPDTIGQALTAVLARMDSLDKKMHVLAHDQVNGENGNGNPHSLTPAEQGVWRGEDFMI
jgi:serine O-acetyltransferase